MKFRKDINGLRAIAVMAVVFFHFDEGLLPGGFSGVDIFFVISGYLMTGIIFSKVRYDSFSIVDFYLARANRIIPALAVMCLFVLVFGGIFIAPVELAELGKHVTSSLLFISNLVYWRESGYFESVSGENWLLHTWSLSVEWQFYIIFPLLLLSVRRFIPYRFLKYTLVVGLLVSLTLSLFLTYKFPNAAYYSLATRAWEMMAGGVVYLFPIALSMNSKRVVEFLGVVVIMCSIAMVSSDIAWPGWMALFPVLGAMLVIYSDRNDSVLTGNIISQYIGRWSYSIYLWHWPLVVLLSMLDFGGYLSIVLGVLGSIFLGFLSYRYVEGVNYLKIGGRHFSNLKWIFLYCSFLVVGVGLYFSDGMISYSTPEYRYAIESANHSPYRSKCHIDQYQNPSLACEYFSENVKWAVIGDSHVVEVSYSLADKLKDTQIGVKQFTYSGCKPSYSADDVYSECSRWYNDSVKYIIDEDQIENVVIGHRYTKHIVGDDTDIYPYSMSTEQLADRDIQMKNLAALIDILALHKKRVYVVLPVPELNRSIQSLIGRQYMSGGDILDIYGNAYSWYLLRNKYILEYFETREFPPNVSFLDVSRVFCDQYLCRAVEGGNALYFDDDHPSLYGAKKVVDMIDL